MNKNLPWGVMPTKELMVLKSERDARIVECFKQTQSIRKTQRMLDNLWSREVIRRCITKAGLWNRGKREYEQAERAKTRRCKPSKYTAYSLQRKIISREYPIETQLVSHASNLLKQSNIEHKTEVQVNGCQMRADIAGRNWAAEAKVSSESQSVLIAMAQAMVYRRHLGLMHVCVLLPDDCHLRPFYESECRYNGVEVVYLKDFVEWVKSHQGC